MTVHKGPPMGPEELLSMAMEALDGTGPPQEDGSYCYYYYYYYY